MKKVVLLSALVIALFTTGCSSKKELVCTQALQGVSVDMILGYENDKLLSLGFKEEIDLSSYSDSDIDAVMAQDYCPIAKQSIGQLADAFINCKQSKSGKKLILTGEFDIEKIPTTEENITKSMDEAAKELEKQGFSCKK